MALNLFDGVLGLEEQFYDEGYQQGLEDGVKAGQIEGRTFGLEKGFEKYIESGRFHGKSLVWANRMPGFQKKLPSKGEGQKESVLETARPPNEKSPSTALPSLPNNQRLGKHIKLLHALSESDSLSTENTEEAVSDFDDRLKRVQGKAKIIERMVDENDKGLAS